MTADLISAILNLKIPLSPPKILLFKKICHKYKRVENYCFSLIIGNCYAGLE